MRVQAVNQAEGLTALERTAVGVRHPGLWVNAGQPNLAKIADGEGATTSLLPVEGHRKCSPAAIDDGLNTLIVAVHVTQHEHFALEAAPERLR